MTRNQQQNQNRERDFPWPLLAIPFLFIGVFIGTQIGKEEKAREQPLSQPGSVACDGAYFIPGQTATCELYDSRHDLLMKAQVRSGVPYCGASGGYVKCLDKVGEVVPMEVISAMCPWPTCPTVPDSTPAEVMRE